MSQRDARPATSTRLADRNAEGGRSDLFDASAKLYTATFPYVWRYGFRSLHPWLASRFAGCRSILDAGTGPGYWASYLASVERRERVVGLDFSPEFIRLARARTRSGNVEFVCADLTRAPFADASFDGILCSGVLDTFPDPAPAFFEFRRLLRPGGRVVLILRGRGTRGSKLLERFFRFCVGATAAIRRRSMRPLFVPEAQWSRKAIWCDLPDLAAASGLELSERDARGLITKAVLVALESAEDGGRREPEAAG